MGRKDRLNAATPEIDAQALRGSLDPTHGHAVEDPRAYDAQGAAAERLEALGRQGELEQADAALAALEQALREFEPELTRLLAEAGAG